MEYAKELTKNYLKKLGVTKVTRTGKVYKNNKPAKQNLGSDGYLRVTLYDKDIYNLLYPITKQRNSGEISIAVHRIVYTWFNEVAPNGLVIDHIDNNKQNNNIDNLQALTPGENI